MKEKQQNLIASNTKMPRKHINTVTPIQQTNQQTKSQHNNITKFNNSTTILIGFDGLGHLQTVPVAEGLNIPILEYTQIRLKIKYLDFY